MPKDAFSRTRREETGDTKEETKKPNFPPGKKVNISATVDSVVLEVIGTKKIPGLISYINRSELYSSAILQAIKKEYPEAFNKAVKIHEAWLTAEKGKKGSKKKK